MFQPAILELRLVLIFVQDNILVDWSGVAKISDFSTARLLVNDRTVAEIKKMKGNVRWMAIELLTEQHSKPDSSHAPHNFHTKESDVWAFGMVIYVRGHMVLL